MRGSATALVLVIVVGAASAEEPFARLGQTKLRHADRPLCIAFSPDGTKLYSGGKDSILRVWRVATGEPIASATINSSYLLKLDFVQKGKTLAALYSDGGIHFLDPITLEAKGELKLNRPTFADISEDGAFAAVLEGVSTLNVFDARTGLARLELPDGPVAAMSPDGITVASADTVGTITRYRTIGGKPLQTVYHGGNVTDIRFRADGKRFATADEKHTVKVWDPNHDKPLLELANAGGPVHFLGESRLAVSHKGGVGLYDLNEKKWVKHIPEANGAFAVSPDGKWLAAVGTSGLRVRIWNLTTGELLHRENDSFANVSLLLPRAEGPSLVGIAGSEIFQWKVGERQRTLGRFSAPFSHAVLGERLIAVQTPGLAIWDNLGQKEPSRVLAVTDGVTAVAITKDGKLAAYSDGEKRIALFDPARGKLLRTLTIATSASVLAFSPDGSRLAILGCDGWLRVWSLGENEREVWKHRFARNLSGTLAISADGRLLAAATANQLTVLDAATGEFLFSVEKSETNSYFVAPAFSADGRKLCLGTAGTKGSIQVWDTKSQTEMQRIASGGVRRLAISADGMWIYSAGDDETICVWK